MAYSEPVKTRKLTFGVFAMCLVLGTVVLLMWPLPVGPYSVTHGPTTALRATRAAVLIVWKGPESWVFTRRLHLPRAATIMAILAVAVVMMWSQAENYFIYFRF